MKKNFIFSLFALATMLFTASCSEQELVDSSLLNGDVVTFNVTTEIVGTRAADTGEGALATKLYYGVYEFVDVDKDGDLEWSLVSAISKTTEPVPLPKEGTVVNIRLAKQKTYSVIFWAQSAENALCTVDWTNRELKVQNATANQESYDAFWGYDEVTLTGALKREKVLVRPFAQLNIGVSEEDYNAAIKASVELENSAVTVRKVPTKMSLVDGTVSGLTETSKVVYASAAIPTSTDWNFPVSGNKYLALNYVLVGTDQKLIDVELSYTDNENGSYSSTFTDVPVRRNYRTNIYGNLLTSDAGYSVKIEAGIAGNNNVDDNNDNVARSSVSTVQELQEAINNAKEGETNIISFENDINASTTRAASVAEITVLQKENIDIIIDGRGYKFDGIITVDGNGRSNGAERLTFKNIIFSTASTEKFTFINAPSKLNGRHNYSHNITIEDCSFEYVGNAEVEIGSATFTGTYNLVMKNCIATNMHSALQVQSCDNTVYVENVEAINCKNGISFGNTARPTLKNSKITAREYGVRCDGNASRGDLLLENTTVTAKIPLVVRKLTTNYKVALGDGNEFITTPDKYQIVFTNGNDDAPFVEPTGTYTVSGLTKGLRTFPVREVLHEESGLYWNGNNTNHRSVFFIYDAEDLLKAVSYFSGQTHSNEANKVTFELLSDINMTGKTWTPWTVMFITVNANGHTISNLRNSFFGYAGGVTLNDLTLENVSASGNQAGTFASAVEGATFNNCVLRGINTVTYVEAEHNENGVGAISGTTIVSNLNVTIDEGTTVTVDMNTIENTEKTTFADILNGYKHTTYAVNTGTIINNGTVSIKASKEIVATAPGIIYSGDHFKNPIGNAFVLQKSTLTDDATITIKRTYGAIVLDDIEARLKGDAIVIDNENNSVMVLENCDFTLAEGKKLIKSTKTIIYQVFMANITVNGVKLTQDNAAQYLENVGWYQVVDPSIL